MKAVVWIGQCACASRGTSASSASSPSTATHRLPLAQAPEAYSMFQKTEDGAIKVVLTP